MILTNLVNRLLARLSTFGPVSTGAVIPADARPISEADDNVEPDMKPVTQERRTEAGGDTPQGDDTQGGSSEGDQAGDGAETTTSENEDGGEGDGASGQPSPEGGTTDGAQEAEDSAVRAAAQAVRAAVDAVLASPDTDAPGKMKVNFRPTITPAMMQQYEKDVEKGNSADALADLIGAAVSEALGVYDERRVLPVELTVAEAKRNSANDKRIAEWAQKNAEDAQNPALWSKMVEIYANYRAVHGERKADRVSMDQLATIAKGDLPASKRKGTKATASEPETQKRKDLGATKTPGALGVIRPKAAAPAKGKVSHSGAGYREHLQRASRDLW